MSTTKRKLVPNALCSQIVKAMVLATAEGDSRVVNECVRVLTTHFSSGTILGDVVRARTALEKAFESGIGVEKAGRILERARSASMRFTRNSLLRAFENAISDAQNIESISYETLSANTYDELLEAWSSDDIVRSVEIEDQLLGSARDHVEPEIVNEEVDSSLLPLVIEKAGELLERMAHDNFSDDPRKIELLRTWSNAVDAETFKNKAVEYIKEANTNLAKIVQLNEGTKRELASESKRICEELLYGERAWDNTETLKAIMLVLESERVLRRTLSDDTL